MKLVLGVLIPVILIALLLLVQSFSLLPTMVVVILGVVLAILCLVVYLLMKGAKVSKVFGIVTAIIVIIVCGIGNYGVYKVKEATKVLDAEEVKAVRYNVLVHKDSKIKEVKDIKGEVYFLKLGDTTYENNLLADIIKDSDGSISNLSFLGETKKVNNIFKEEKHSAIVVNDDVLTRLQYEAYNFKDTNVIKVYEYFKEDKVEVKPVNVANEAFIIYYNNKSVDKFDYVRDYNSLIVVNPKQRKLVLIEIPYDYYIPLACLNDQSDELSNAETYGKNCAVESLENLIGQDINYFLSTKLKPEMGIDNLINSLKNDYKQFIKDSEIHTNLPAKELQNLIKLLLGDKNWDLQRIPLKGGHVSKELPTFGGKSLVTYPYEDKLKEITDIIKKLKEE